MDKEFFKSKTFRYALALLGTFIALAFAFHLGEIVGYHKASFSYRSGERYFNAYMGGPRQMMGGFGPQFPAPHGVTGQIVKISLPTIFVADRDNTEKEVIVSTSTVIRRFRDVLSPSDLRKGDIVVILGSPDQNAEIEAGLIRVLPEMSSTTNFFYKHQ